MMRPIKALTSRMAIGSLQPLSNSKVAEIRELRRTPLLRNSEKTAAASVEPTIAAINTPNFQSILRKKVANIPSRATVAITPQVAKTAAGLRARRKLSNLVRRPPSSRMMAKASWPTMLAKAKLSNLMPPKPSSPANMPTTRKTSNRGMPKREETRDATTLMNSSRAMMRKKVLSESKAAGFLKNG